MKSTISRHALIVMIMSVFISTQCAQKAVTPPKKHDFCACIYGYRNHPEAYTIEDEQVLKKYKGPLVIPAGTSEFRHMCGKSQHFINWEKELYVFKIGDMDYRIIVTGEKIYTISDHDTSLDRGLIIDSSITAKWGRRRFSLAFKTKDESGKTRYDHEIFFEDEERIGLVTFNSESIQEIDPLTCIIRGAHDYTLIKKKTGDLVEYHGGKIYEVRGEDCKSVLHEMFPSGK